MFKPQLARKVPMALAVLAVLGLLAAAIPSAADPGEGPADQVRLTGHVPNRAIAQAHYLHRAPAQERVELALALPLRNQAVLDDLLHRLYDPTDPLYGKYLTCEQFTAQFGPTEADYDALVAWARAHNL